MDLGPSSRKLPDGIGGVIGTKAIAQPGLPKLS
jgi:hypothetical protein